MCLRINKDKQLSQRGAKRQGSRAESHVRPTFERTRALPTQLQRLTRPCQMDKETDRDTAVAWNSMDLTYTVIAMLQSYSLSVKGEHLRVVFLAIWNTLHMEIWSAGQGLVLAG